MDRKTFEGILARGLLLGDGATGTQLLNLGMPAGVCPELWAADHPEAAGAISQGYLAAGSRFVTTPTFGGSPAKLAHYGLADRTEEINAACARNTRLAAGPGALVAANIGPTGELMRPMGELGVEEMIALFQRQVAGLLQGDPDFFLLETFMDPAEARAAVLAIRELTALPFVVSMTFQNGRTLTGAAPGPVAALFTALGASAVGCNCSGGPDTLEAVVREMAAYTRLPVLAKPNAGMPEIVDGKTVFHMGPEEFARGAAKLVGAGASIVGGCCGTTPEHIRALGEAIQALVPPRRTPGDALWLASPRKAVALRAGGPLCVIGERINPSGKPELAEDIARGNTDVALDMAMEQRSAGVHGLDVNAGAEGIGEAAALLRLVEELSAAVPLPLSVDSVDAGALEAALRGYCGRALLNSVSLSGDADRMLAIARKYGAVPVLMPLDGGSLPESAEGRVAIVEQLLEKAYAHGFEKEDVLIDCGTPCLALCAGTADAAVEFARRMARHGFKTIAGVSNVSFRMPNRAVLNAAYLAMLMGAGLCAAILNPTEEMMDVVAACDALRGSDDFCGQYIQRMK